MTHDVSVVDGHRCASAAEIDQCDSVLHLCFGEDSFRCGLSCEVFLVSGYIGLLHHLVDLVEVALLSDEDLEVALEYVAGHTYDVVLDDLEILSVRE